MLPERDQYEHDYTVKYYPKISNIQFYHDMMKNGGVLNYHVFKNEFNSQHALLQQYRDYGLVASVIVSVATIYFFQSLPLLSRIKGKWTQFFTKLSMLGLPYATVYIVTDEMKEKYMWDQYIKHFRKYIYYKQTGDIRCFSAQIQS